MNKFKFIIPAYNCQNFLNKCLDSIEIQDYPKELIEATVIDDCSEFPLCTKQYSFSINLQRNKKRMYPAFNRFQIYSNSNDDDIIIFLDGDDWLADNLVLSILNKIYRKNKIHWTISNHKLFFNSKLKVKPCFVGKSISGKPKICHLRTGYGYVWNKMPIKWIKKDNENIKWMSDWNENLWALKNYSNPYKINSSLCVYNLDTSKTRKENKDYHEMIEYFDGKMLN